MGNKASPAAIGAFVIGAIALAVIGLVVFGSGKFFRQSTSFVCFFTGDVNGLSVGAPVVFKGVRIGAVEDIRLRLSDEERELTPEMIARGLRIPVIIEIDNDQFSAEGGRASLDRESMQQLIDLGLRAQLIAQSFVTGLLAIQLDFNPDMPATFMLPPDSSPQEIPTIPTQLEQVQSAAQTIIRKIEDLEVDKLIASATDAADSLKTLLQAPALQQTIDALPGTVANVNAAIQTVRQATTRIEQGVDPLVKNLGSTADVTSATLDQARASLARLDSMVEPTAPLVVELLATLEEFRGAARSVRLLADYLDRNPSALVRGRAGDGQSK